MAKRKYTSKRKKKTNKKSNIGKIIKYLLLLVILCIVLGYLSFRHWKRNQLELIKENSQTVKTTLGNIEYQSIGKGPIILLSHMGASGSDNVKLLQEFADQGYRVICPSRPGYKETPLFEAADFNYQADILAELLASLNISEKVFVAGISIGGPAAIQFAVKYPGRCKGLILLSAVADKFSIENDQTLMDHFQKMNHKYFKDLYSWIYIKGSKFIPKRFMLEMLKLGSTESVNILKTKADSLIKHSENKEALFNFNSMTAPFSIRMAGLENDLKFAKTYTPSLKKIKVPVFIAHSTVDRVVPFTHAQKFSQKLKNAELYSFEGYGHAIWFGEEWKMIVGNSLNFMNNINSMKKLNKDDHINSLLNETWISNEDGSMLTIESNNTFTLDFPGVDENKTVKGNISLDGNKITFLTKDDSYLSPGIKGTYEFKIKKGELHLILIEDKSKRRKRLFTKGWYKL